MEYYFSSLTPLHLACALGEKSTVDNLLRSKPSCVNCKLLEHKVCLQLHSKQHIDNGLISIILKYKNQSDIYKVCDIDKYNNSVLNIADPNGVLKLIRLLQADAVIDSVQNKKDTPLHLAAFYDHKEILHLLLKYNANVNVTNDQNWTPLMFACQKGHYQIVKLLLENQANIEMKSKNNLSAVHLAAKYNHKDIVKLLLKYSANINGTNDNDNTALHEASSQGHTEIVQILLEHRADLKRNCQGNTPFHLSKKNEIIKLFFLYNADPNVVNNNGESVFDLLNKENLEYGNYIEEINKMKEKKLNYRYSLYDFLFMEEDLLATYVGNDSIKELIDNPDKLKVNFSNYSKIMRKIFEKALQRKKMTESALSSLEEISGATLPELCHKEIFKYLNEADLKKLSLSNSNVE